MIDNLFIDLVLCRPLPDHKQREPTFQHARPKQKGGEKVHKLWKKLMPLVGITLSLSGSIGLPALMLTGNPLPASAQGSSEYWWYVGYITNGRETTEIWHSSRGRVRYYRYYGPPRMLPY